jgi:sugar phosphate isomerase/epimerase
MQVGILTARFGDKPLDYIIAFAGANGIDTLEVASGPGAKHLDTAQFLPADCEWLKSLLAKHGVRISSLAWYTDMTSPANRAELTDQFKKLIEVAKMLEVDVVCTLAGMPVAGKDKMQTIEEDCAAVFPPTVDYAAAKGIKVALENWYATCLQGLAQFDKMFEVVPHENFGLNFDPSHLLWQGIDYIGAVERYGKRIFHTHAKDTEVRDDKLAYLGNQMGGWWRYVIPGFGRVKWGEYIAALRRVGYHGVLSIEHEDSTFGAEEGFVKGKNYLRLFV